MGMAGWLRVLATVDTPAWRPDEGLWDHRLRWLRLWLEHLGVVIGDTFDDFVDAHKLVVTDGDRPESVVAITPSRGPGGCLAAESVGTKPSSRAVVASPAPVLLGWKGL